MKLEALDDLSRPRGPARGPVMSTRIRPRTHHDHEDPTENLPGSRERARGPVATTRARPIACRNHETAPDARGPARGLVTTTRIRPRSCHEHLGPPEDPSSARGPARVSTKPRLSITVKMCIPLNQGYNKFSARTSVVPVHAICVKH